MFVYCWSLLFILCTLYRGVDKAYLHQHCTTLPTRQTLCSGFSGQSVLLRFTQYLWARFASGGQITAPPSGPRISNLTMIMRRRRRIMRRTKSMGRSTRSMRRRRRTKIIVTRFVLMRNAVR